MWVDLARCESLPEGKVGRPAVPCSSLDRPGSTSQPDRPCLQCSVCQTYREVGACPLPAQGRLAAVCPEVQHAGRVEVTHSVCAPPTLGLPAPSQELEMRGAVPTGGGGVGGPQGSIRGLGTLPQRVSFSRYVVWPGAPGGLTHPEGETLGCRFLAGWLGPLLCSMSVSACCWGAGALPGTSLADTAVQRTLTLLGCPGWGSAWCLA